MAATNGNDGPARALDARAPTCCGGRLLCSTRRGSAPPAGAGDNGTCTATTAVLCRAFLIGTAGDRRRHVPDLQAGRKGRGLQL